MKVYVSYPDGSQSCVENLSTTAAVIAAYEAHTALGHEIVIHHVLSLPYVDNEPYVSDTPAIVIEFTD